MKVLVKFYTKSDSSKAPKMHVFLINIKDQPDMDPAFIVSYKIQQLIPTNKKNNDVEVKWIIVSSDSKHSFSDKKAECEFDFFYYALINNTISGQDLFISKIDYLLEWNKLEYSDIFK